MDPGSLSSVCVGELVGPPTAPSSFFASGCLEMNDAALAGLPATLPSYCRSRSNAAHVSWTETSRTEENRACSCCRDGRVTYSASAEDPDLSLLPSLTDLSTLPSFPSLSKTAILLPDLKCQGGIDFLIHHLHSSVYFVCSIRYHFSNFSIAVIQRINNIEGRVYLGLQLQRRRSP